MIRLQNKIYFWAAVLICLVSCDSYDIEGMINGTSEHIETRFKQSMEYNTNTSFAKAIEPYKTIYAASDEYTIYWCSDIHISSSFVRLDSFIDAALSDTTCLAVMIAGDLVDGKGNLPSVFNKLERIRQVNMPMYCTPGNHDICFSQWNDYVDYWGTSCYWFDVVMPSGEKDLYISCDSGEATLGKSQRKWLEQILKEKSQEGYEHIIVMSHTPMFKRDMNKTNGATFPLEEIYDLTNLFSRYGVEYYINGHDHTNEQTIFNNVIYYTIGTMKDEYNKAVYMVMNRMSKKKMHLELYYYKQ